MTRTAIAAGLALLGLWSTAALAQGGDTASPNTASAAPPDLDSARRAVFVEAVKALEAKDWATCTLKATAVWGASQHPQTAALLGICEAELGKYAEAAEHLDYHRQKDPGKNPDRTEDVEAAWQKVRPKVGIVSIAAAQPEVDLTVDGKPRGRPPITLYLTADVTIEAKKLGYKVKVQQVSAKLGESQAITLALEADRGYTPPPDEAKSLWPAILLGGVAAAGLGVGIGLTVASAQKSGEADDLAATCVPRSSCSVEGDDLLDEVDLFQGIGIGGFVLAAAAGAGLIAYLVVPTGSSTSSGTASPPGVVILPAMGPSAFGLHAIGSF